LDVRRKLSTLPETLDETYKRILLQIQTDGYLDMALRLLQWLCFAKEKLNLYQLVDALATDFAGNECFSTEARLGDPFDILTIGSSLVSWTTTKDINGKSQVIVSIAHFSVQEYLLSSRTPYESYFHPNKAHNLLAESCLIYAVSLLRQTSSTDRSDDISDDEWSRKFASNVKKKCHQHHLLRYAAKGWYRHTRSVSPEVHSEKLDRLSLDFFTNQEEAFRGWVWLCEGLKIPSWTIGHMTAKDQLSSPLYYSITVGLDRVTRILMQNECYLDCSGNKHGTPLQAAAYTGNVEVIKMLIQRNASIDLDQLSLGTPLELAVENQHIDSVRLLLDMGAQVNGSSVEGCSDTARWPLYEAVVWGKEDMIQVLAEYGAAKELSSERLSVLVRGLTHGFCVENMEKRLRLVRWLISIGASPDDHQWYRWADPRVLILLLNAGAWPNTSNSKDETLLHLALSKNNEQLLALLLDKGADVNFIDNYGQSCLDYAVNCPEKLARLRNSNSTQYRLPP
jgi:ankyrin repeat protein